MNAQEASIKASIKSQELAIKAQDVKMDSIEDHEGPKKVSLSLPCTYALGSSLEAFFCRSARQRCQDNARIEPYA
eukprot:3447857-Amphidinium_carterae.1